MQLAINSTFILFLPSFFGCQKALKLRLWQHFLSKHYDLGTYIREPTYILIYFVFFFLLNKFCRISNERTTTKKNDKKLNSQSRTDGNETWLIDIWTTAKFEGFPHCSWICYYCTFLLFFIPFQSPSLLLI